MPDISAVGHGSVGPVDRTSTLDTRIEPTVRHADHGRSSRSSDRVELSDHARMLSRLNEPPASQRGRVEQIRESIADGTYETDEKLGLAIERMIEELNLD
jgi:anti-sigma28 factor (negative regulator of flagellin synthesis)